MNEGTKNTNGTDNNASGVPVGEGQADTQGTDKSGQELAAPEVGEKPVEEQGKFRTAVSHLKDLKELVAILVFFIGGAVWIYTAFATKQYVAGVRCLLASTIERIDNEAQSRELKSEIIETGVRQQQIRNRGSLTAVDIVESETLSAHMKELEGRKALADRSVKESSERILQGECEK